MNRSQRRDNAFLVLRTHHRAKRILDADVPKFEALIRRCRTDEETQQVLGALHHYMEDIKTASDRYARLARDDDPFDDSDDSS